MLRNNSIADIKSATSNSSNTSTAGQHPTLTSAALNSNSNTGNARPTNSTTTDVVIGTLSSSTTTTAVSSSTTTTDSVSIPADELNLSLTNDTKPLSAALDKTCLNYVESTTISSNALGIQKQRLNELITLISDQETKLNKLKAIRELAKEQTAVNAELTSELKTVNDSILKKDAELHETLARVDNLNRQLTNYRRTRAYRNSKNVTANKKSNETEKDLDKALFDKNNGETDENGDVSKNNLEQSSPSANGHSLPHDIDGTAVIDKSPIRSSLPLETFSTFALEASQNATSVNSDKTPITDNFVSVSEQAVISINQDLKQTKQVDFKKKDDYLQTNSSAAKASSSLPKPSNTHHQSPAINKYTNARQKLIDSGLKNNGRRVSFDPLALLLDAALEGELDLVIQTSKQVPDLSASHDECVTALHNAVVAGHYEVAKYLIEAGCDINVQDSDGWTPLHCAASCNNLALVKLLIENGALIYATTSSDDFTPAMKCDKEGEGFEDCYKYLTYVQNNLGVINNGVVYALYDYTAQEEDELSFITGEELVVLRRDDSQEQEWWWAQQRKQPPSSDIREGYIPRNLVGLYPRVKNSGKLTFSNSNGNTSTK